jgi:hypothetical protein
VGREKELSGLSEALAEWEAGRPASVLIVGMRGSGKTSLLNCAEATAFSGRTVVRSQFCSRLITPSQVRSFLGEMLRVPNEPALDALLNSRRRVVMIEELERTFLRAINGFEGLRGLLDLISSTSGSTLWIFSLNEAAFQYLDAVLRIGQHFTHRINAMSASPENLQNAILQRHHLSGLRLQFSPPASADPRAAKLRRFLGLERDAEELFFESLYQHSEGIFRSAFELWQGCIERVEGGVVYMRQPLTPDYASLEEEVTGDDCFLLQAVLQHGGLTLQEAARVLGLDPAEAERRVVRLLELQVLEPEPTCPGFRVLPEAGRFVRTVLHRHNLV